jgi:hypothetical protein
MKPRKKQHQPYPDEEKGYEWWNDTRDEDYERW